MTKQSFIRLRHLLSSAAFGLMALAAFAAGPADAQSSKEALAIKADDPSLEWGPCPAFMPEGCSIAVLQGKPSEPRTDIFFRLEGNTGVDRHLHTSAERMVLVAGEMSVDYDGQESVTLGKGTYAYGPPELPHSADCISSEPCVLYIGFNEPVDAMPATPTD
ncbi:cupin domain-containing protein [Nitratireductor sp. GCM10026969]|uniref:cupin domain-containing protein n=1 Tax=Nitratireductor sp. GCM10026969 TaxID=3252645 RepID=UPI0036129FD3